MDMFGIKPEVAAKRKKDIIELLSSAQGADAVLPMSDRVIIADLAMSGTEKIFETLEMHLKQCMTVFADEHAVEAVFLMTAREVQNALEGVIRQRAIAHAESILGALPTLSSEAMQGLMAKLSQAGVELPSLEELERKARELMG